MRDTGFMETIGYPVVPQRTLCWKETETFARDGRASHQGTRLIVLAFYGTFIYRLQLIVDIIPLPSSLGKRWIRRFAAF